MTIALACAAPAFAADAARRVAGQGRLSWWGLPVYDATLRVGEGFTQSGFERHEFALDLAYLRALRGADIARRSVEEISRVHDMPTAEARRWELQLAAIFPDVSAGDRITGVYRPGRGATFFLNGKLLGEIEDAEFSRRFFGIWLATTTSQPALRAQLMGNTPP